jgi:hypothetical protein
MVPKKLNVMVARFPYGGVGSSSLEIPDIGDWLVDITLEMSRDERIGEVVPWRISDTPISMCRNRAVLAAKQNDCDLLLMIDSDNVPDYEFKRGTPGSKPFWKTAFDFLYEHYDKGPAVIAAPYCGPPPHENVYVFQISNRESEHASVDFQVEQFNRNQAAERIGIEQVAALPTGLILFDVRAFDILPPPWFYYEWTDRFEAHKASTEDVTATRDMMFHVHLDKGYLPLYVAWDCWAGHVKPKIVGKPQIIKANEVSDKLVEAARRGQDSREGVKIVDGLAKLLAAGARPYVAPEIHPVSAPPASFDEDWQTPAWMLEQYGYTPPTDLNVIRRLVQEQAESLGREPVVVELGTLIGQSTKAMACAGAVVFSIDNREGSPHDGTFANYAVNQDLIVEALSENLGSLHSKKVHLIVGDSQEVAKTWSKVIDILYVDADHEYQPAKADILAWMGYVRSGGIIAGHDYCKTFPGVVRAVDELFPGATVEGTVWWLRKHAGKPINRLSGTTHPAYEEDVPEVIANGHAG